jgi:O-antigen/teichoic acid export membrane protein
VNANPIEVAPGAGPAPGEAGARAATRIGRDAGVLMAGDLVDRGLGFVFLVTATKLFGLELYGAYLVALGLFQVVRTIVSFGLGRSLVRDTAAAVAVEDAGRLKGAIQLAFLISLPLSVVCGAVLAFGSAEVVATFLPTQPKVAEPMKVFGALTPLFSFNFVLLQSLYGMGRIRDMVVANNVVEPTTRLVAVVSLFGAGVSGYYAIPGAYAIALVVSSAFAFAVFLKNVWPSIAGVPAAMRVKETLAFATPLALNDLATRSLRAFNIGVFAVYRTAAEVSIFNVALKLTGVAFFFSGSLMGAFRPRIAALLARDETETLSAETRVYTRWILTFALLPYGLMIAFPSDVLGVLGPQFLPAATTLRILCVALLIGQGAGPIMTLLVMSGRSRQSVYFLASAATIYTALALQVVPRYGTVGGAMCGLATILVIAPVVTTYVQRRLRIRLYGRRMLKPIFAIAVALAAGFAVSLLLPGVDPDQARHVVRIGRAAAIAVVVVVVYLAMLVRLGIEPEERAVLAHAVGPLSKIRRKLAKLVR